MRLFIKILLFQIWDDILFSEVVIVANNNNIPYVYDEIKQNILLEHRIGDKYRSVFHKHNGYEIYLILQGDINLLIENSCFHIERGTLAVINPTEYHRAVSLDGGLYERYTLNLNSNYLRTLSTDKTNFTSFFDKKNPGSNSIVTLPENDIEELIKLFTSLKQALYDDSFANDVLVNSYCMQILHFVCRRFVESDNIPISIMPTLITDTIQYISDNISKSFTLADIENELGYNKDYISKSFRQYTGIQLKKYILEKKITLAKSLLAQGQSVTDVCYNTGFNDYSNFIRTFKNYTGHTPKQSQVK